MSLDSPPTPHTELNLEEIISPDHLAILTEASGGFSFRLDPTLPPDRTGYTNKDTKEIFLNPLILRGMPEYGISPMSPEALKGFFYHEAGHHTKEVLAFDHCLQRDIGRAEIVPDAYRGSPSAEARFFQALYSHLHNALIDVWDESFMGRRPFYPVRSSIEELADAHGNPDTYTPLSKPEQLLQVLLRTRYMDVQGVEAKVDPDVLAAIRRIEKCKAMGEVADRRDFENYFATPVDRAQAIARKFEAYRAVFLPEYLKLLDSELQERKQKKMEEKKEENKQKKQRNTRSEGNEGKKEEKSQKKSLKQRLEDLGQKTQEKLKELFGGGEKKGKGRGQEQNPAPPPTPQPQHPINSDAAPLTKEEEEEIGKKLLEELIKAGEEYGQKAPEAGEEEAKKRRFERVEKGSGEGTDPSATSSGPSGGTEDREGGLDGLLGPEGLQGEEVIRALIEQLLREDQARRSRGLAESLKVREESVKSWENIKERNHDTIESLATQIAEIFLEDRRRRIEYLRRQGDIVPGLEYETVAAYASGEATPDTHMESVQNPEFLETEWEWIVDTSGSMSGEPLRRSVEMIVIVTEAMKRVREILENEDLLTDINEQPFRIGLTLFDVKPHRITRLTEPLSDKKEILMIDRASQVGGGTSETTTITEVYREMRLGKKNVVKIIVVLSDADGDKQNAWPVIQQIEEDDEVILLVVALAEDEQKRQNIVQTYLKPLKKRKDETNVFAIAAKTVKEAEPKFFDFLRTQVDKRRPRIL